MARFLRSCAGFLGKAVEPITNILYKTAIVIVLVMAVLITLDIILRSAFSLSLHGLVEIQELAMGLMCYCLICAISKMDAHIQVDFMISNLPEQVKTALKLVAVAAGGILFAIISWRLGLMTMAKYRNEDFTMMLAIRYWPFMGFCCVASALFVVISISQTLILIADLLDAGKGRYLLYSAAFLVVLFSFPWWFSALLPGMSKAGIGAFIMLMLFLLIFLGIPLAFAMGLLGMLGMLTINMGRAINFNIAFNMVGNYAWSGAANSTMLLLPMFALMGEAATRAGISSNLFYAARVWLGRTPASLGVASVMGCAGFAAICGDSLATAATMTSVALPPIRKQGYDPALACGALAAGGTLGILIPPSVGFIWYSIMTEQSVGRLFMAGMVPGIILALCFVAVLIFISLRDPSRAPRGEATTFREKLHSLKGLYGFLFLISLVLGGMLVGFFSPNEAGAVGASGTILFGLCTRNLKLRDVWDCCTSAALISGKMLLIFVGVGMLGSCLSATQLPMRMADLILALDINRYLVLLIIVVFYIFIGCMMNVLPAMLLTLPSIFPTVVALGFDPIWFGVLVVMLMEMGVITPPVGMNVFTISSMVPDVPIRRILANVVPFFFCMLFVELLITIFPGLTLWLPNMIYGAM